VIRVPLYSAASTTKTPIDMPLMMRLRFGKFCGAANVPTGNSAIRAPPKERICSASHVFSFGYETSTPVPNTATVFPFRRDHSAVCGGVHAASHATDDHQSVRREINRQALRHSRTVKRRVPGAYDGNPRLGQDAGIAAHIK